MPIKLNAVALGRVTHILKVETVKGDGNHGKPDALRKSEIMIQGWSTPHGLNWLEIAYLRKLWVHIRKYSSRLIKRGQRPKLASEAT